MALSTASMSKLLREQQDECDAQILYLKIAELVKDEGNRKDPGPYRRG